MPEALATTKRKFHRLLDTVTTLANAAALPKDTPELTARDKLAQASERVRKRQRHEGSLSSVEERLSASTTSLPHKLGHKPNSKNDLPKELPNFSPWSQEKFFKRLQSFSSVALWHSKPDAINEVAWAKRGWTCVEVNTVACLGGCNRRVVVETGTHKSIESDDELDDDEAAFESALTQRYVDEIVDGHAENCMWRRTGCKDDIYRIQVVRPAIWQPALQDRYSSLLRISTSIKDVTVKQKEEVAEGVLSIEIMHAELAEVLQASDTDRPVQLQALDIALEGWQGSTELGADLLKCDVCFQRIGLWMYQPGYHSRTAADEDEATTSQLNLAEMHREYCPWRSSASQQASGSLSGLNAHEILLRVITTYVRERRRKVDEGSMHLEAATPEQDMTVARPSRAEIEQQDRERESRMQKLKRLLNIKRTVKT